MIHDAVLDYYGRRLATCSSDRTIKIFDVEGDSHRLADTLKGHDGPVWSVSWAHPKFGTFLASGSYAGAVHVHRETAPSAVAAATSGPGPAATAAGGWTLAHASAAHGASVNAVAWAPHEAGCILAAASSDGAVSLLELSPAAGPAGGQGPQFAQIAFFAAHALGANCVSWAPGAAPGSITGQQQAQQREPVRRFVTGGSDCAVKVWELQGGAPAPAGLQSPVEPVLVCELPGHTDWVRDVAWSSTVLRKSYIASASQDKTVRIWTSENGCTCPPSSFISQILISG
jgi:protein transport protein SEC13